jgi:hypothetical protein
VVERSDTTGFASANSRHAEGMPATFKHIAAPIPIAIPYVKRRQMRNVYRAFGPKNNYDITSNSRAETIKLNLEISVPLCLCVKTLGL